MTPEDQYRICVDGLSDFAAGIGATDVVLGLSGGIDSSLVACMCVDAFGADHVHGYMLPGPYSSEHSLVDAQELGRNLGLHVERISIVEPYEAFAHVLGPHCAADCASFTGLAAENTQAQQPTTLPLCFVRKSLPLPVLSNSRKKFISGM